MVNLNVDHFGISDPIFGALQRLASLGVADQKRWTWVNAFGATAKAVTKTKTKTNFQS